MENVKKRAGIISLVLIIVFSIADCGENGDPTTPPDTATPRYETVPYSGGSGSGSGVNYNPVYSAYDNTNNYYLFVLGHVNYVPIAYRNAIIYDGQRPVDIGYSSSTISETSISRSVEEAYTYSVTNSFTSQWSISLEVGLELGKFSAKVSGSYGETNGWDETNTRSVANTFTAASSWSSQETDTYQTTIGNNNESTGKYRFSLFATTDVYYVLVTNRERTQVTKAYTAVCARPQSLAWGIDYEPDMNGSFAKTAGGNLLTIPVIVLSQLPNPIIELPPPEEFPLPQQPEIKTFYIETRINNLDHVNSPSRDETVTPDFITDLLKRDGYSKVIIDVEYRFRAETIWGGDLRLQIASAHKTRELGRKDAGRNTSWGDGYFSVTVPIESLDSPACEFMLLWSKRGLAEYCVGRRTISITAIK
jgi:hypothetical protein